MPIYSYRCDHCGVQFDRQQRFSDKPLNVCPECGKQSLRKLYQPVGIVFKGSGFYATDHRSPSGQTNDKGEPKSDKGDQKQETSTEKGSKTEKDV
jgi:putative FmdB family regulatory protein